MLHCRACLELVQSVINAAARLTTGARKYDHVTPLLKDLHWLRVTERITYLLVVRSCIQLSSRYGATLLTRRHPVCRCNLTPSSPVDILVRPDGSDNAINPTPSFRRRGTSCMEQSSSIRHRLHNAHLQEPSENISRPTYFYFYYATEQQPCKKAPL